MPTTDFEFRFGKQEAFHCRPTCFEYIAIVIVIMVIPYMRG